MVGIKIFQSPKTMLLLAAIVSLSSCNPSHSDFDIFGKREFTSEDEKYHPIAYYRSFPRPVQRLLQHADIEDEQCSGGSGDHSETLRACNRREVLMGKLENLGWCWTSLQHAGYADHWMRCADDLNANPDRAKSGTSFYSAVEIRQARNPPPLKFQCRTAQKQLPLPSTAAATRFDIFGTPNFPDFDVRDHPESSYSSFPPFVRGMLRLHDMEMSWPSDSDAVERLRTFNRRNRLLAQIEDKGWCWGSTDHISSTDVWMKCSDIDGYTPDQPRADSALFDLEDMRKAVEGEKAMCL